LVTPNAVDCQMQLAELRRRLIGGMRDRLESLSDSVEHYQGSSGLASPPRTGSYTHRRELDDALARGHRSLAYRLQMTREQLRGSLLRLEALSPLETLQRGYCVCMNRSKGVLVTTQQEAAPGDHLEIRVSDGIVPSIATESTQGGWR